MSQDGFGLCQKRLHAKSRHAITIVARWSASRSIMLGKPSTSAAEQGIGWTSKVSYCACYALLTGLRTQAKGCSSPRPVLQGKASLHIFVSLAFNKSIMSNAHKRDFRLPTFVLPSVILRLAQVFLQSICAWHPGRQLPLLTWPWLADALGRDAVGSLAPGPV